MQLMHINNVNLISTCPHCGGEKEAQVSVSGFAGAMESRIVKWFEVANYRHMPGASVDGVWCNRCGTMFHPSSV